MLYRTFQLSILLPGPESAYRRVLRSMMLGLSTAFRACEWSRMEECGELIYVVSVLLNVKPGAAGRM